MLEMNIKSHFAASNYLGIEGRMNDQKLSIVKSHAEVGHFRVKRGSEVWSAG